MSGGGVTTGRRVLSGDRHLGSMPGNGATREPRREQHGSGGER
jgi:hypothetical protein